MELQAVCPAPPLALDQILNEIGQRAPVRRFQMCEVFGGTRCVTSAFNRVKDGTAACFDVRDVSGTSTNIHTKEGLILAAILIASTLAGGVRLIQPTCGSWVWVSRGVSLRGLDTLQRMRFCVIGLIPGFLSLVLCLR